MNTIDTYILSYLQSLLWLPHLLQKHACYTVLSLCTHTLRHVFTLPILYFVWWKIVVLVEWTQWLFQGSTNTTILAEFAAFNPQHDTHDTNPGLWCQSPVLCTPNHPPTTFPLWLLCSITMSKLCSHIIPLTNYSVSSRTYLMKHIINSVFKQEPLSVLQVLDNIWDNMMRVLHVYYPSWDLQNLCHLW